MAAAVVADDDPILDLNTHVRRRGLGFYRFSYNGSEKAYVGVIAQEVWRVIPQAVVRGPDGYLRVNYDKLGVKFESYREWIRSGAEIPGGASH